MIKKFSFLIGILLFTLQYGQKNKEQLQKQNAELKKQIAQINSDLAKTRSESKLSIAYLDNVNKKLALREKVYNNTQKEKRFIEDEIYLRQLEINRQNRELKVLRDNYAKVLVNAYKNKGVQNKVTFILSAKNLGEAIRRVQYLKQYSDYQDKKAAEITNAAAQIKRSIALKQNSAREKANLLVNQQKDLTTINAERAQKEQLVTEFKKNESKLTAELKQKQTQSKALEGQIRVIIAEEIRRAKAEEEARKKAEAEKIRLAKIAAEREKARIEAENKARAAALEKERLAAEAEARKTAELAAKRAEEERKRTEEAARTEATARDEARKIAAKKASDEAALRAKEASNKLVAARAAEAALTKRKEDEKKAAETKAMTNFGVSTVAGNNFAENKGRMSFPVEKGQITHRFGRHPHPVFKNIDEENNGIKISVPSGTRAKSVFPGTVSSVLANSDGTKTVMLKHGNYFTIYSNLASVSVSKGQQVSAGTLVGVVGQDFDGSYTLDFQVWNGTTPVDPLGWVSY
ncbi:MULTISPECIES: peptidoglycan DD-metalloendopeptidase family protein [Chryseobacterium]|uniref:Septal ring factor EnvC (AmiA/AmiB activator) n=1 Tax=Chryseobacterium geocarposphaerae TaxID=1416776 RepID=A0ABU1LF29_9FLAO|nr:MULTISPECIES: peptidoglycan DD-metalloendopeptidase family protein [Chryseobacterium]MDR6405165.1 septal ring factor EnvC (AmiA/AmiB activator) [Chryseobacterium geocarposphaerae]MDR6700128.1 septal ring factor EnvC (AmiA/AmiB activator) [Chryseobacterium ginsenosidimutans]